MKYDILVFDADETLFDFKKAERMALEKTLIHMGIRYNELFHLPLYKEINTAIWKELEDGQITQKKLKIERFTRYAKALELEYDSVEFAKNYMGFLSEGSYLYENALELIKTLSESHELIMITNGLKVVQENRIKKSVLAPYFKSIIVSEEVGVSKPDVQIFKSTFEGYTDLKKERVLMIGDSLTSDIQGGINFGIDTCWYNSHSKLNESHIKPTYNIQTLTDLYEIV